MMFAKAPRMRAPSDAFLSDVRAAQAVKDKLRFALEYGVLAPGGHPWMITIGEFAIDLRLGHRCQRASHDGAHRDAILGCGMGLAQLRLALRQLGCVDSAIPLPDEADPELLARVYIDRIEQADPESYMLYQALQAPIAREGRPLDLDFQRELAAIAEIERAKLVFTPQEMLPPPSSPPPCGAPTLETVISRLAWMEPRAVNPSGLRESAQEVTFENHVGAVIATRGDTVADWLSAGQALARVALRARIEGLYTRVVCTPRGARAPNAAFAQIAIRFGVPERQLRPDVSSPETSEVRRLPSNH
jgi:hypothetical protein